MSPGSLSLIRKSEAALFSLWRAKKWVCFYFIFRYSLLWTLLTLPWKFNRSDVLRSPWLWGAFWTVYISTPRRFDLYSPSSRSRRFNFGQWFTKLFIWMGRHYYLKSANYYSNSKLVFFRVRHGKSREIFLEKVLSALRKWVFFPQHTLLKVRKKLKKMKMLGAT